ncbi:hypothetical protein CCM_02273 [Cordyceps militaris CM01]|uniref:Centromere protein H C-terminal domain-containing protein n=1 Tax=Cordyceps militaris (strain CM01) TaxID=983644 RepID=G3J8R7_CORMM|nr:uncharacterized protein CCM_02273 [Cordyceps militaris CM01]EGX94002.1 hypothetical protein CCM_02273 [Cordyceps militaris CM01]
MDDDERMEDLEEAGEPPLALSDAERQILEEYDRLHQMDLEIAIIKAQKAYKSAPADDSPDALAAAQEALLQARSRYKLRNDAVELVVIANPVLKAVHGGTNASPIDRYAPPPYSAFALSADHQLFLQSDLLPFIVQRDDAAVDAARSATQAQATRDALTDVQVETLRACRRNVQLTSRVFELAAQLEARKAVDWDGGEEALRVRDEKRKWRAVKGAASGIVAGSGVDWASDEALRDMVLDPEDDD